MIIAVRSGTGAPAASVPPGTAALRSATGAGSPGPKTIGAATVALTANTATPPAVALPPALSLTAKPPSSSAIPAGGTSASVPRRVVRRRSRSVRQALHVSRWR